jgi:hypothetical protein
MANMADKVIVIGTFVFIGFLIKVLSKKLNINIKHPIRFSLFLWCIGMGIIYLGYILYEANGFFESFLSNSLYVIGAIIALISASIGFYTIFNPPPQDKPIKPSRTEKFVTSITESTLRKIYGHKRITKNAKNNQANLE